MNRTNFYDVLFNRGEGIGYQTDHGDYRKNRVVVHNGDQDEYNFDYHFYSINPIHPTIDHDPDPNEVYKPRIKIANVTSFRNFAIEFDEDTLEEQKRKLQLAKPPVSAVVFSGSKSLHTPIALEEPVVQEEYSAIFEAIKQTLLKYDLRLDPQCSNPNRLTRAPFQIRNNDVEQKLIGLRGRIPNQVLFDWFEENDINWKDYIFKIKESPIEYEGRGDADDEMRWRAAVSSTRHFNGDYNTADQWQPWIYELGKWCKAYGLDEGLALSWATRDYTHPDSKAIPTGIKNGYKYGNLSPRTLNKPRVINQTDDSLFDNLLDEVKEELPYDFNINNYAWIGPDIFLIYPDGKRIKYTTQGFNARFKTQGLNTGDINRIYSGEGYYPDYFNRTKIKNNMYNAFCKPDVKLREGEWPMTEILLRHIFGDQYELGLEYYWVLRHHPTRPLPAIALTGGEDAGKTSWSDHLEMCFKNTRMIDIDQLTQRENSFIKNTQIIVVEESSDGGINKLTNPMAIANKVKTLVTQCGKQHPIKELYNNAGQTDYFGHVILLTNDITPIKMAGEATRYWVLNVGKPRKIVDFMEKVQDEVGYFLWYLDNKFEPSRSKSKERLWFHPDEYYTEAKDIAKTASGSYIYKKIKESLIEWFKHYPDQEILYFDQSSLKDWVHACTDDDFKKGHIKECLVGEFGFGEPADRATRPDHLKEPVNGLWSSRKMSFWAVTKNFELYDEREEMGNLLEI